MLLRRITEHVRAQNWTAVALDFLIVVAGVFIGIQVSNWNAGRLDKEREIAILVSIQVEMRTYSDELERAIAFARAKQSSARALLRSAADSEDLADNIDALIADLTWWQTSTSSRDVLVGLLSDTNFMLIHDHALKADLQTWPSRMNFFEETQRLDKIRFEDLVLPFLIKKAFLPQISASIRPVEGSFNEASIFKSVQFPPEHRVDHQTLLKDPEFLGIVVAVDWDQAEIVASAEKTQADIENTISALAAELK